MIDADEKKRGTRDGQTVPDVNAGSPLRGAAFGEGGKQALDDWLRIHRELLAIETAFTDLAIKAAMGEVSAEELAKQRTVLEATRELCTVAYQRAFPKPRGSS